jgi:hypothetical protein
MNPNGIDLPSNDIPPDFELFFPSQWNFDLIITWLKAHNFREEDWFIRLSKKNPRHISFLRRVEAFAC